MSRSNSTNARNNRIVIIALLLLLLVHGSRSFAPGPWHHQTLKIHDTRSPAAKTTGITTPTALFGIKGFRGWFESQFPSAMNGFDKHGAHETFDHVLIDVNQLLHNAVRKSHVYEKALVYMMKELDACVAMATPTQSLILAMDGPPGAAKLSTQRSRRRTVVMRSTLRLKQLDFVMENGKRKFKKSLLRRKKEKASADLRTLPITPGTDFMEKAAHAILYWAWQRMSNPNSPLRRVKIYLSPSTVPGEGEVKILEWIYTKRRKGSSIAIISADSDLVLEGLIVTPTSTHDIFVLLPDGGKRCLAVSLWETTRTLQSKYFPHMNMSNMMRIRTDLVVLFILNGNDYLPKLRAASGFNRLFRAYTNVQKEWHNKGKTKQAYLVDPDSLAFSLDFCIDFFSQLMGASSSISEESEEEAKGSLSPLNRLNTLCSSGMLPLPIKFRVFDGTEQINGDATAKDGISSEDGEDLVDDGSDVMDAELPEEDAYSSETEDMEDDDEAMDIDDDDEYDEEAADDTEQHLVRLSLGKPGTDDFYTYDLWCPKSQGSKSAKHKLAGIAVSDLLGFELPNGEMGDEEDDGYFSATSYDWELKVAAESKVDSYLYGILWNLQTYQDGISADFSYNYGKRKSPTAEEVVAYMEQAKASNQTLAPSTLSGSGFVPSINAGLSCLAALPSNVRELIPHPYSRIPEEAVEEIYSKCVDPLDNRFDMLQFEELCDTELHARGIDCSEEPDNKAPYTTDNSWTVVSRSHKPLSHPFDPPPPFSEKLSRLRKDRSIRISHYPTIEAPRRRDKWHHFDANMQKARPGTATRLPRIVHSSPGRDFLKLSIDEVPHRTVYTKREKKSQEKSKTGSRRKIGKPKKKSDEKDHVTASSDTYNDEATE